MEVGQVRRRRPARLKSASRDRVFYPSKRHRSFPDRDDVTQSREKQNVDPTMVRYIDLVEASHSHARPVLGIGLGRELGPEASWSSVRPKQRAAKQPKMRVRAPGSSWPSSSIELSSVVTACASRRERSKSAARARLSRLTRRTRRCASIGAPLVRRCCTTAFPPPSTSEANRRGHGGAASDGRWLAGGQMTSRSGKKKSQNVANPCPAEQGSFKSPD